MNTIAIIPARMGSTRFPGKPLAPLHGIPMLGHVVLRTSMSKKLSACYVATCDQVIFDYCKSMNFNVVMTKDSHTRCTSRVAEAVEYIEEEMQQKADIVLMVQGDEPMVTPQMIDTALDPMLIDPQIQVLNLMALIESEAEFQSPNTIKVVTNNKGDALFFSRLAIPSHMHGTAPANNHKQVCIIPFRREALFNFENLAPTSLELAESIDMLRLLEHGLSVRMVNTNAISKCVDTPEDLTEVSKLMQNDHLMQKYL